MIKALALTGPTASGKTALSINIAEKLDCEIISLDSMQIYKGMDIGTAKATASEKRRVPHHMIDIISPRESFSAKAYRDMAMEVAKDISFRGKIPLFVGGTGLYLSTLQRAVCEEAPESDMGYRERYSKKILTEEGRISVWERLREVDPASAEAIHYNNTRRVIRALEIFETTGKTKSYFDELSKMPNPDISIKHVTLDFHNRDILYERADLRVRAMLEVGLLDEVRSLLDSGELIPGTTASQAIGYKEMLGVIIDGDELSLATEVLQQATRNYAKRQLTWFRNTNGAIPVFVDSEDGSARPRREILTEVLAHFTEN